MMENNPLISILICNYNYEKFICETLESISAQDYPNIEVIVIDDGSTDDSVQVVKKYINETPSSAVRLHAKKKNQGICYARNDAIDMAKGEYFLFVDSDDTIPSTYVSKLYSVAVKEGADVVYGDVKKFGADQGVSNYPVYDRDELFLRNYINISALVKKSSIKGHRFDLKLNNRSHEDYDFWLGLSLMKLTFSKAQNVFLNYRIQEKSRNENNTDMMHQQHTFIDIWWYSINKYKKKYPSIVSDVVFKKELDYQIDLIGGELSKLNDIVQAELLPELKKREIHAGETAKRLDDLMIEIAHLQESRNAVLNSRSYKAVRTIMKPARVAKRVLRRNG